MEERVVIFLAFVSATVITNTVLIWFAYKAFVTFTSKVTETVSQFEMSSETRAWLHTLQSASEEALAMTESAKAQTAEVTPVIDRVHQQYRQALVEVDSRLETIGNEITTNAKKMRDTVAKPAFSVLTFVAGLARVLETMETDE